MLEWDKVSYAMCLEGTIDCLLGAHYFYGLKFQEFKWLVQCHAADCGRAKKSIEILLSSRVANILSLQLPKHKSVVVTLNDSDDSESDGEASKSTNSVFGGLESMIKEARRTAEVSAIMKDKKKDNLLTAIKVYSFSWKIRPLRDIDF